MRQVGVVGISVLLVAGCGSPLQPSKESAPSEVQASLKNAVLYVDKMNERLQIL